MSLMLLLEYASTVKVDEISFEEKKQIEIFRKAVFGENTTWYKPTYRENQANQYAALHVRAHNGDGKIAGDLYNQMAKKADAMVADFEEQLISALPQYIFDNTPDYEDPSMYPKEIQDAWIKSDSKRAEIFDRLYLHKIFDYIDRINGL